MQKQLQKIKLIEKNTVTGKIFTLKGGFKSLRSIATLPGIEANLGV